MDFVGKCVKFSSAGDKAIASFDCSGFLLTGTKNVKQNFLASLKSKSCVSSGGGGSLEMETSAGQNHVQNQIG